VEREEGGLSCSGVEEMVAGRAEGQWRGRREGEGGAVESAVTERLSRRYGELSFFLRTIGDEWISRYGRWFTVTAHHRYRPSGWTSCTSITPRGSPVRESSGCGLRALVGEATWVAPKIVAGRSPGCSPPAACIACKSKRVGWTWTGTPNTYGHEGRGGGETCRPCRGNPTPDLRVSA
jgi:hypothetical protein